MTTNIKLGFPDIPFNVSSITSSATYSTNYPVNNLVTGAKSKFAELTNSMVGTHFLELNLGSGISQASDYIALLDAKRLKASKASRLLLRGSDASYTSPLAISGLIAWFDPNRNINYNSSRQISQINDQSSNANHAAQSTDANKPLLSRADNKENLCLYSYDWGNANYASLNLTSATSGVVADSNGEMLGTKLLANTTFGRHGRYQNLTYASRATNASVTYSVEVKKSNHRYLWIGDHAHASWHGVNFDFDTASLGTQVNLTSASLEALSNSWYKITITYNVSDTGNSSCTVYYNNSTTSPSPPNFTPAGTEEVYVCHASWRDAAADTVYIKTEAAKQIRGINGNHSIVFDGSDDYLPANTISTYLTGSDKPYTIFVIAKQYNTSGTQTLWGLGSSSSATPIDEGYATSTTYRSFRRGDTGSSINPTGGTTGTSLVIVSYVFSGTAISVYLNGSAIISSAAYDANSMTVNRFTIGALVRTTTQDYFKGKIGDFIIFNSALSTTDRETIESYLTSKWSDTPIADIDIENMSFTGGQNRDYIEKFAESSEYQYWITQFESESASKRALSKLYFGKMLDIGRDPKIELKSMYEYSQDKAIAEQHAIELEYDGISTANLQTIETKINDYADTNQVLLITNSYNNPLLGNDLLSCDIKSFTVSAKGGRQHALTLRLKETI